MPFRRRAFTLVELLVVLGIIIVLIALIAPAVVHAREQAQRLRCTTNLYALGQALALYTQHWGYFPQGDEFPPTGHHAIWAGLLWELAGRSREVFNCPARPEAYWWTGTGLDPYEFTDASGLPLFTTFGGSRPFSYAYNIGGTDPHLERGIGGTWAGGVLRPLRVSRARAPSELYAIGDGPDTHGPPYVPDCFILVPTNGVVSLRLYPPSGVHRGKLNMLFCDGHVECLNRKDVVAGPLSSPQPFVRRHWNFDNQL